MSKGTALSLNEYQNLAARTAGAGGEGERRLIISALGLAGEAGEFANMVKKLTAHGHNIAPSILADELGDVLWYCAMLAKEVDMNLGHVMENNINKLHSRKERGTISGSGDNR